MRRLTFFRMSFLLTWKSGEGLSKGPALLSTRVRGGSEQAPLSERGVFLKGRITKHERKHSTLCAAGKTLVLSLADVCREGALRAALAYVTGAAGDTSSLAPATTTAFTPKGALRAPGVPQV